MAAYVIWIPISTVLMNAVLNSDPNRLSCWRIMRQEERRKVKRRKEKRRKEKKGKEEKKTFFQKHKRQECIQSKTVIRPLLLQESNPLACTIQIVLFHELYIFYVIISTLTILSYNCILNITVWSLFPLQSSNCIFSSCKIFSVIINHFLPCVAWTEQKACMLQWVNRKQVALITLPCGYEKWDC